MIDLFNITFTPTMRCNLKCKYCGVLVPQYEFRPHMNIVEVKKHLDVTFKIVDHVTRFQITGGEPLMHPQILDIIKECFRYEKKFDEFWFISNGILPVTGEMVALLSKYRDKVKVDFSVYSVDPQAVEKNCELLEKNGIFVRCIRYYGDEQDYGGWVDQGDFERHGRSTEENELIFQNCYQAKKGGSWYLRNGQFHWCGRSIRGTEVGKIPLCSEDYLDLFEEISIAEKRKKMEKLMHVKSITACDYCNGLYGTELIEKRIPAGEQISC